METVRGSLVVRAFDKDLEIMNSRIRIRLFFRDGGYAQEFYAVDTRGHFELILTSLHKDLVTASDFRTCSSPMIAGERQHLFGICRESLRMVYSNAEIVNHDEKSVEVKLSGSTQGHTLDCRMTLEADSSFVHITVTDTFGPSRRPPLIEYVMNSFAFVPGGQSIGSTNELDYVWSPTLRSGDDCVIGDRAFHSPALIIQHGQEAAALIPDLKLLAQHRSMPTVLDMDLNNGLLFAPLLSYGFCGYEYDSENKCCRHDVTMATRIPERKLVYGYHLLLDAKCRRSALKQNVARFAWEQYGTPMLKQDHCSVVTKQSPQNSPVVDARSALGLYYTRANKRNDAINAVEGMLGVIQNNGLFATRYDTLRDKWIGCNISISDGVYNTVECSEQLYWLLQWHRDVEPDKRIIAYCRRYADFLIESRLRTGAIPSWYTSELHPLPFLRSSIQTAASVLLLAELAKVTGLVKYKSAAERSASFVLNTLVRDCDYRDHTIFDDEQKQSLECSDPHSGCSAQSGRAMLWAAEMCLAMYELTDHRKYLDLGTGVLDQLCLLQSVWEKPWENDSGFGMLSRNNMDANYDPELTVDFAQCALRYAAAMGNEEYAQRGEAAIRSIGDVRNCRIAARVAGIQKQFGSVYVHVGRKWAVCTDGVRIEDIEFQKGGLSLHVLNRDTADVMFGGMRGSRYKVTINGVLQDLTQEQMKAGVSVPAARICSEDTQKRISESSQPGLFD